MEFIEVRTLYESMEKYADKTVTVRGWVRTVRDSKVFGFIELNDGSYLKNIQIVLDENLNNFKDIIRQNAGAALIVTAFSR